MITELRMSPITDEILEKCWDYLLPVKVDDIASRLGVTIRPLDEDLCKDYSGFAFVDSTTRLKHIYYNQSESFNRQRFTKAHELGYLVLEHTVLKTSSMMTLKVILTILLKKKLTSLHLKS